jgi:putative ABC transport system substrate-binding protein
MRSLGYVEDENFRVDWRFMEGQYDRLAEGALELVKSNPDVIVATTQGAVRAAQHATTTIPIVMAIANDPVQMGLIETLAHPGGNTTGASSADEERILKQLDLSAQLIPGLSRVAVMFGPGSNNPRTSGSFTALQDLEKIAQARAIVIQRVVARDAGEIAPGFSSMRRERAEVVIVRSNPLLNEESAQIINLALEAKLPLLASRAELAENGALMSYGESLSALYRRVAYFVDKIFKGAKPSDLPVELPSRLTLTVNQQTAKSLGLIIPHEILAIADRIIE